MHFALPFLKKKEKYLILAVSSRETKGLLLSLDEDNVLSFEREWDHFPLETFSRSHNFLKKRPHVVAVADESGAYVVTIPIEISERSSGDILTAAELENVLGHAVSRMFTQYREEAAGALGASAIDTVLIGSRVYDFTVDGHRVVTPIGFSPKQLHGVIELIFTRRDLYMRLKPFFARQSDFFFTEEARAELFALRGIGEQAKPLLSLRPGKSRISTFRDLKSGFMVDRKTVPWSSHAILDVLGSEWGVTPVVAEYMCRHYVSGTVSKHVAGHMKKLFRVSENALIAELTKANAHGHMIVESPKDLPFSLYGRRGIFTLTKIPIEDIFRPMGITVATDGWPLPLEQMFHRIAPFVECYYHNDDIEINHWLKRRLHWLGAALKTPRENGFRRESMI